MAHSALKQVGTLDLIEDCNDLQSFDVDTEESCRYLKVSFATSTDFYGRVTLYKMEVFGYIVGDESTADDAIQSWSWAHLYSLKIRVAVFEICSKVAVILLIRLLAGLETVFQVVHRLLAFRQGVTNSIGFVILSFKKVKEELEDEQEVSSFTDAVKMPENAL